LELAQAVFGKTGHDDVARFMVVPEAGLGHTDDYVVDRGVADAVALKA
jgi:hypothetical protein